jgi:hypothetical protein
MTFSLHLPKIKKQIWNFLFAKIIDESLQELSNKFHVTMYIEGLNLMKCAYLDHYKAIFDEKSCKICWVIPLFHQNARLPNANLVYMIC